MTLIKRLPSFFGRKSPQVLPDTVPENSHSVSSGAVPTPTASPLQTLRPANQLGRSTDSVVSAPIPYWLADEAVLRDEGVLFGLSDTQPDEKIAEIRAYFTNQITPLTAQIDEDADKLDDLKTLLTQRQDQLDVVRTKQRLLQDRQPVTSQLVRTLCSLGLTVVMCVANFFLIAETLRPVFANQWIAVGIFLAGMFSLAGRSSLFYEGNRPDEDRPEKKPLTGRQLLAEGGLLLTASVFILAQALRTQPVGQAIALFAFVFALFLLAGKLLFTTLTNLAFDLATIRENRQLLLDKTDLLPQYGGMINQLERAIEALRTQQWAVQSDRSTTRVEINRLNARCDQLVNLFLSEYELARSLRNRVSEQQRLDLLRSYNAA